ncbi:MAG TPA: M20/M25/M40 family metallo-hydrolase [Ignavibacteriaceae bacterium]
MKNSLFLRFIQISFLCLLFSIQLFPQRDSSTLDQHNLLADQIIRKTLTEKPGYKLLQELCDIGPRLSGSENSLRAIHWAEEKLKSFGVDRVWLQPVMVPHWERGNVETAEIMDGKSLNILSLGESIPTPENGITANVIEVKNFTELKERQNEVKGKIVFFSRPLDEGLLNTFAGYGGAVDQRFYGAVEAAKYGAVAVLIRSITTKHDNVPHTGVMGYVDSLQKIPAAAIGYLDSDYLHNALVENPDLKIKLNMDCKTFPDAQSYNVVAEITGSEFPNEIIVVGSHFDSWDVGCGAHDDGAGCVQSMEVLYLLKELNIKPKRTIRCVLFINEENGSRGGKEYGKFVETNNENHLAAIESDRGGFTPIGFDVDSDSASLIKIKSWLPVLEKSGINWVKKGGSGVDVQYIKNTKAKLGYVPDVQRYMDVHHSANDTFESIHPRELELGAASIAIMAYLISEEGL